MLNTKFLLSLFILLFGFRASYGVVGFTQNDGQIVDQFGNPNGHVLFSSSSKTWQVMLNENGFSYQNTSPYSEAESNLFMISRMDVSFRGMNDQAKIETYDELLTKLNYPSVGDGGICGVSSFSKVIYKNVYPNIDVAFAISPNGQFEYDFILNPGADISDIQLEYAGCEDLKITNNLLSYTFASQTITESIPAAFELSSGQNLSIQYGLEGNRISFVGEYNHDVACVIDPTPTLAFASYFGGEALETGPSASISSIGELVWTGSTYSTGNLTTSGAYQTIHYGTSSAYLMKLDATNQMVWCTYFGGTGDTSGSGVTFLDDENIIMVGNTTSPDHIATQGAIQGSLLGVSAVFIAHFNSNGTLIWCSYFAPSSSVIPNSNIAIDKVNDSSLAIAFSTYSIDLPLTVDALQSSNAGSEDLVLGIFEIANHSFEWLTYFGGSGHDNVSDLEVQGNMLYISSSTMSNGLASSGAFLETMPFIQSVLVSKINLEVKSIEWSTYMYGSDPMVTGAKAFITVDDNFLYCNSTTTVSGLASIGSIDNSLSGTLDMFISKMSLDGQLIWSRYYGGTKQEYAGAITTSNGQLYLSGLTQSSNSISTAGSLFPTIHHATTSSTTSDNCYASFDANGNLLWGNYFGDFASEGLPGFISALGNSLWATCISYNASTQSINQPFATAEAFQLENAGDADAYIVKFDLPTAITENNSPQVLSIYPNPTSGLCSVVGLKDISSIDVVSITGQLVLKSNVGVGQNQISLDLSALASGYYTLRIFNAKGESKGQYPVVRE